jgi:nitrous oxidase accessory protein
VAGGPLDNIASSRDEGPDEERGMLRKQSPCRAVAAGRKNASLSTTPTTTSFATNWFERCGIGVHFTAGSEGNEITGNAFVGNRNR